MRILITSSTYAPARNGQAVFTTSLAEGMVRRGHEVWLLAPSDKRIPYRTERSGVQIQTVRAFDLGFIHSEAYGALLPDLEVRKFFNSFQPDVVHIQEHHPLSRCALDAARRRNIKVIGTNHFMPENLAHYVPLPAFLKPAFNRLLWSWMGWTFNSLDVVTAPSRTAAEIIRSQGLRVPVIPISCGVDPNQFHPDPSVDRRAVLARYGLHQDRTIFLFVGRVDTEKRVDVLIRAAKKLARDDIQLAVAGEGADLPACQSLVRELGVEDRVRFTGFVPAVDLPALLNSVDYFAMPSEAELLSIASLEAMATGLPLLAARSQALPELVDEGVNGFLFNPGDADDACRCMSLLADHPERRAEMGAASLKKVKPHSLENVLARYEELYTQCAANGHQKV